MKRHWADRDALRDLLWFLVLPHRFKAWHQAAAIRARGQEDER